MGMMPWIGLAGAAAAGKADAIAPMASRPVARRRFSNVAADLVMHQLDDLGIDGIRYVDSLLVRRDGEIMRFADQIGGGIGGAAHLADPACDLSLSIQFHDHSVHAGGHPYLPPGVHKHAADQVRLFNVAQGLEIGVQDLVDVALAIRYPDLALGRYDDAVNGRIGAVLMRQRPAG